MSGGENVSDQRIPQNRRYYHQQEVFSRSILKVDVECHRGHLLFSIYDMPNAVQICEFNLYADDMEYRYIINEEMIKEFTDELLMLNIYGQS